MRKCAWLIPYRFIFDRPCELLFNPFRSRPGFPAPHGATGWEWCNGPHYVGSRCELCPRMRPWLPICPPQQPVCLLVVQDALILRIPRETAAELHGDIGQ